ncbi:HAMP domain-containing sensor histidine kinase [Jatrophihabitans sp.]|uniref:sensor histidine kinase n=1 Tax=Jatrophihabitans sp. TaxID=1932789 RepID=UPI0030C771D0|nr:Histidine kinase [Jatrophihabitans sp.]
MSLSAGSLLTALLWSLIAAAMMWVLLAPVRRRYLTGLLASVVLTGTAASLGALLGGIHEMLLPMHQWVTVVALTVAAGIIATVAAALAARRLAQDNRTLLHSIGELAQGRVPEHSGRPLTAVLEALRSELAATASALADTRDRERALESARRDLISWVSHDLRTPLAGLRAMSEALEDGVADDPQLYYKQIASSADRLSGMVDDLFDLSRIQAGAFSRDTENIALDDLVSDCVAALGPLAAARGVELCGRSGGGLAVIGNGPELNRALTNLIANAIRHTRLDGTVLVSVSVTAEDQRLAEVTVSDECGGIPIGDLDRVFEVGFRGEEARTPTPDEALSGGLGLAITRGIVEAHDGSVGVENTFGGCTFRVLLPVAA